MFNFLYNIMNMFFGLFMFLGKGGCLCLSGYNIYNIISETFVGKPLTSGDRRRKE